MTLFSVSTKVIISLKIESSLLFLYLCYLLLLHEFKQATGVKATLMTWQ